ncbi:TD and POZ domain-containing protein 3 [Trichonephila inaurata madagascariensis]|uniref:TD and POZ domain-containing protein 3 n=1 Tax=Trichonephila inaurata madagascariensis TaxID=2747483 RepID=A0A8X6YRH4_9ARAC|nr:TD and POZ domain-containing protein 3 [Trichonephila inaurata madagascariensis]
MLRKDRTYNDKKRYIWSKILNNEWTVICVCSQNNPYLPDSIEIHRKPVTGEFLISGTLDLCGENKKHIVKKSFFQLLENGCSFSRIKLIYSYSSAKPPPLFSLMGDIIISETPIKSVINFVSMKNSERSEYLSLFELSDDFGNLLKVQSFSDVKLKCGDEIVPAHKSILSARSPVFAAMFQNKQMREAVENEVNLVDTDISVLQIMLSYVYTGKTGPLTVSFAMDLLVAADKYQLLGLKKLCCDYLKEMVSTNNATKILVLGDMLAPDLKDFAMDFICNKCGEFSALQKSEHWEKLEEMHSVLAMEVLTSVLKAQEQKLKECKKKKCRH